MTVQQIINSVVEMKINLIVKYDDAVMNNDEHLADACEDIYDKLCDVSDILTQLKESYGME